MNAHLIANTKSGKGAGATLPELAEKVCAEAGANLVRYPIDSAEQMQLQISKAIEAASQDGGVVIAAGGDGTIRGVAEQAAGRDVKFAVVPCGTFNFFARTHFVPEDLTEAFRLAVTGETRPIRLGEINGHIFLINASLGLYAKSIQEREKRTSRWGRNRIVVIISTVLSMLSLHRLLNVDMKIGSAIHSFRTPMIFIGNNALQLRDLAFDVAKCMKQDLLAVVMMKPLTKLDVFRVIFRGLMKMIEKEESLISFCVDTLTIHTKQKTQTVALDGEMFQMTSPFQIKALPGILNMVLPPKKVPTT